MTSSLATIPDQLSRLRSKRTDVWTARLSKRAEKPHRGIIFRTPHRARLRRQRILAPFLGLPVLIDIRRCPYAFGIGRAFGLLTSMALAMFMIHALEIWIYAAFYLAVGAIGELETALYFSASAYTTLGHPDVAFPIEWRLVGAFEGLTGFLLIGWSIAVFVTDMNKLLRK